MSPNPATAKAVRRRTVLHFAGFEPLDGKAHHERYVRSAAQSARVWGYSAKVSDYSHGQGAFTVTAEGPDWTTESRIHIFEYDDRIAFYRKRPLVVRIATGYLAGWRVVADGAAWRYMRHAWRFGLFFFFPFVLMSLGLLVAAVIAATPLILSLATWHLVWSIPLAAAFFRLLFVPISGRYHMLHLFSDWEMAAALARLEDAELGRMMKTAEERLVAALADEVDEIVITSHSMGSNYAVHVLGSAIEKHPHLLDGKTVTFVTLGGALLQCAFLESAHVLRRRAGLIARQKGLIWLDVQCLTDIVNFFRTRTLELCGHPELEPAAIQQVRFRRMLDPEHYKRVKRDMLRVHRQYVLGPDLRAEFDFTLLTAGPFPAAAFAGFSPRNLPPLAADGSLASARQELETIN